MNLQQNLKIISCGSSRAIKEGKRVVIDFSSPNIAKPFHFGHLKSTILGNFLANLHKYYGNEVVKLNYIGDWGTQYGLLSLGLDQQEQDDRAWQSKLDSQSALQRLLDVYVEANERGEKDVTFYERAKRKFLTLDEGKDPEQIKKWRQIRDLSLAELKSSYADLSIDFDVYEHESDYAAEARQLVEKMRSLDMVETLDDGVQVVQVIKNDRPLNVPLLKSDKSSLYITRDVAAALRRQKTYKFDRMLYVVGAEQEKHFHSLREIIRKFEDSASWADSLIHVKTGKIKGMSSRTGQLVLLSTIIDEAKRNYMEATRNVVTSKASGEQEIEEVGKHLALSAMFVFDMQHKRTINYSFDWSRVMQASERSGIHLQTTHAKMCSLLRNAYNERNLEPYATVDEINYDAVCCLEGFNLIQHLNQLDKYLAESYQMLDPSPLVSYAFTLSRATNRARKSDCLHVIKEPEESKARSRLTLFESARSQLEFIIKMIGLKPLWRL